MALADKGSQSPILHQNEPTTHCRPRSHRSADGSSFRITIKDRANKPWLHPSQMFFSSSESPPGKSCQWISFSAYEQMPARDKCTHDRYVVSLERRELTQQCITQQLTGSNS